MLAALGVASLFFLLDQDAPKFAKRVKVIMVIASLLGGIGLPMLLAGLWRLHSTLHVHDQDETPVLPRRATTVPNTASLPAPVSVAALPAADTGKTVIPSVTEGTTDLLPVEKRSASH